MIQEKNEFFYYILTEILFLFKMDKSENSNAKNGS